MDREEILRNYSDFKKTYLDMINKDKNLIDFEVFETCFYPKSFFIMHKTCFFEDMFYETILDIVVNALKNFIHESEYFVNLKPQTTLMSADYEILKNEKDLIKIHLKLHKLFKTYKLLIYLRKENSVEVSAYAVNVKETLDEFLVTSSKVTKKLIVNIDKKLDEIDKSSEVVFESAVFN